MSKRVLFVSNGHGEDSHSAYIIRRLRELSPDVEVAAIPIVGLGSAYHRIGVPVLSPTLVLPSGGFTNNNRWLLLKDIQAGLLGLTLRQLSALRRHASHFDLVHATGDSVGQSFAYLSGCPFISFISCLSALYEGTLPTDFIMRFVVRSHRCRALLTRDPHTAKDLRQQGFEKARFGGIPYLDWLRPGDLDLALKPDIPMAALLPGSRMPEAVRNFKLQLQFVQDAVRLMGHGIQFRAALVPKLMAEVSTIAAETGWHYEAGRLSCPLGPGTAEIHCYGNAYQDIVCHATAVIGMAGLAVDQAAAIGKPVILIPGEGPQFSYAFAEAQERLLGLSAQMIGTGPANRETLKAAANCLQRTVQDQQYLAACRKNGPTRLGAPGASTRIARLILKNLELGDSSLESSTVKTDVEQVSL